jgi:hypothetical protein
VPLYNVVILSLKSAGSSAFSAPDLVLQGGDNGDLVWLGGTKNGLDGTCVIIGRKPKPGFKLPQDARTMKKAY